MIRKPFVEKFDQVNNQNVQWASCKLDYLFMN